MNINELVGLINKDANAGLQPFYIVGNAGPTNTGAIDDLGQLADLALKNNLWFHVDAAYGGAAILSSTYKHAIKNIE